jgi:hypothetical protein
MITQDATGDPKQRLRKRIGEQVSGSMVSPLDPQQDAGGSVGSCAVRCQPLADADVTGATGGLPSACCNSPRRWVRLHLGQPARDR